MMRFGSDVTSTHNLYVLSKTSKVKEDNDIKTNSLAIKIEILQRDATPRDPMNKGAFSPEIFLWQRSIVTETLAKYLRSHTATKSLKESLLKNLC